jgi:GNAT superfamily N-acetyltransferase
MEVRRATERDGDAVADVYIPSFRTLTFLPQLHTPEEDRIFFRDAVLPQREVWLAVEDGQVIGFAALSSHQLEHLYVHPLAHRRGAGSALLRKAMEVRPSGFSFWVFQQNDGARRFYEAHGCRALRFTDGAENDEQTPDVLYEWRPELA